MDDPAIALAHYRLLFPTLNSLGAGDPPATWKTEYDRVADEDLSRKIVTGSAADGTSVTAIENLPRGIRLTALHYRRFELDSTYTSWSDPPPLVFSGYHGSVVRLGYC